MDTRKIPRASLVGERKYGDKEYLGTFGQELGHLYNSDKLQKPVYVLRCSRNAHCKCH
jgi:hypothetical protein